MQEGVTQGMYLDPFDDNLLWWTLHAGEILGYYNYHSGGPPPPPSKSRHWFLPEPGDHYYAQPERIALWVLMRLEAP